MVGTKPFTVAHKEQLLEYLLEQAEDWDGDSPDMYAAPSLGKNPRPLVRQR